MDLARLTSQFITDGSIPGRALGEAITAALIDMRVGGKLVVFLPSDQAYEDGISSPFNPFVFIVEPFTVVRYEIFPIMVQ